MHNKSLLFLSALLFTTPAKSDIPVAGETQISVSFSSQSTPNIPLTSGTILANNAAQLVANVAIAVVFQNIFDLNGFLTEKIGKLFSLVHNLPADEQAKIQQLMQDVTSNPNPEALQVFTTKLPSWFAFPTAKRVFLNTEALEALSVEEKEFYVTHQILEAHNKHHFISSLYKVIVLSGIVTTCFLLQKTENPAVKTITTLGLSSLALFHEHIKAAAWRSLNKMADLQAINALNSTQGALSYLQNHAWKSENGVLCRLGALLLPNWFWRNTTAQNRIENIEQNKMVQIQIS